MDLDQLKSEYDALVAGRGFVRHDDRTLLRFSGPDAAKFLHNFCTADVNGMKNGDVKEAFVLDSRGKTLSFGHILCLDAEILWTAADRGHSQSLYQHFDKYIIREDVVVEDVSDSWSSWLAPMAGDAQDRKLDCCAHHETGWITASAHFAGPCELHLSANEEMLVSKLGDQATECSLSALDMFRLESLTPWFGVEVENENLPQELRRDETAISFHKGCYLGQETVAKIDAIGQVNKFLVGLVGDNNSIEAGMEVLGDGSRVGVVRSVAFSPILKRALALGYVKRKFAEAGMKLEAAGFPVEVILNPLLP